MIKNISADIFTTNADAIAQGCNTHGRMGAGIAKDLKDMYPLMFNDYKKRCRDGTFKPGSGYIYYNSQRPHIINLATQDRNSATEEFITSSLLWLANSYKDLNIKSVAMPKIGSGLGGIDWKIIRGIIEENLKDTDLEVLIYHK